MIRTRLIPFAVLLPVLVAATGLAVAQDKGPVDSKPLPPLANPNDPKLAAKQLFGRALTAAKLPPHPVGFYAKGCMAGAEALPITGDTWQVMRLSRNRIGRFRIWSRW